MRAWQMPRFGVDALEAVERESAKPGPHDVSVRVAAVALNYRDLLVVDGSFFPNLPLPCTPGS